MDKTLRKGSYQAMEINILAAILESNIIREGGKKNEQDNKIAYKDVSIYWYKNIIHYFFIS